MIRRLFNSVRQSVSNSHKTDPNGNEHSVPFMVESLEERLMLSFVGFFDGITLDLVQTFDDGDVVIDNSGVGGAFRVIDNADTLTFVNPENVTVTMLDGTANQLNFNINNSHTGDVELHLGNGPRDVFFSGNGLPGIANRIGGDLLVTGGTGPQNINLAPIVFPIPIPFQTDGSATFNLGDGFDTVINNENFVRVGGDLNLIGVNLFRYTDFLFPAPLDADLRVGGNLTMDTSVESTESFLIEGGTFHDDDPDAPERSIISGDFIYIGGDDIDHINLNETYIQGDMIIDLGEGIPFFGDPQNVTTQLNAPRPQNDEPGYFEIDGDIHITAGDSNLGNVIDLQGYHDGNLATFNMSGLEDTITYSLLGTQVDITAVMGAGDDTFTMNSRVNVLDIDFGNDLGDEFINNIGQFTFDSDITNFHWFDHLYTVGDDTLIMNQLMDTGDIIIDNDGGPGAFSIDWRLTTALGGVGSTTPASTLVLNMLDNTGNNVEMDLVNPVIAFLTLNLGDGDRDVNFTGASNNPLRDINITADQGDQNIEISVNAPLAVATLNVDLGEGFDMLDDDANNLLISEDLIFRGVNLFENDGILNVTRNVIIDSTAETGDTIFANNSQMFVGGFLQYLGGDGRDELRLNGAVSNSFSGTVDINLGDNITGGTQFALLDGPGTSIASNLTVVSTAAVNPDVFATSDTAILGGNVNIDLGHGPNNATILGVLGGTMVNYDGGIGDDTVIFGTTGNPAEAIFELFAGNDSFTLNAGTNIADDLIVDFGPGDDTFVNLYGPFDFNAALFELDGFNHIYDLGTDTLTSTQVSDPGPVTVDNNGAGGVIQFHDGGTNVLTTVTNLSIHMLGSSGTELNLNLENALAGDLDVRLRSGDRTFNMSGSNNSVNGDLSITGGSSDQLVNIAVNNALTVGGNASIDLGPGNDLVEESGNNVSITGNLDFVGVNRFTNDAIFMVNGNFNVDNSTQTDRSWFNDNLTLIVAGDFSYTGSSTRDEVLLDGTGGSSIGGQAIIHLGSNSIAGPQNVFFNNNSSVAGLLHVTSTEATRKDVFTSDIGTSFGGDVKINLGDGPNEATILGVFGGNDVSFIGGDGIDTVIFGTTGNPADVNIVLGGGNDTFTLEAGAAISPTTLRVDFGTGTDTFNNNYGQFDFNANLLNLGGFNHHYDNAASTLRINQVANTGDITIDNNGAGGAVRFVNGSVVEFAPVTSSIRLTMLSNTNTNVNIDYDNAQAGDTILSLKNGDRTVRFTGDSNEIGGFLRIDAGTTGDQDIFLAVNSDLTVGQAAVINLRGGSDMVEDGANDLNIGTNLILRSVNTFRIDNTVDVGGNFTMNTRFDNEFSILDNNSVFNVGGNLSYFGGTAADRLFLHGADIGGNVSVDLGAGTSNQVADFSLGASMNRLRVLGDTNTGVNSVITDASTIVDTDVVINFSKSTSTNVVTLQGTYGGTYGSYRGGSGTDNLTFGATANNMHFVGLLGAGNDKFTLNSSAILMSTLINFGSGSDNFDDQIGEPHPFPVTIKNLT